MDKNGKKVSVGCVVVGVALLAVIIAVSLNAVKGNASQVSGGLPEPTFTDENSNVYIAVFLKDITENSVTADVIESVTSDNAERVKELNLTEEDMPDGYYIHNPEKRIVTWELNRIQGWGITFSSP